MTVNVAVAVPFKDTMKSMKHLTEKYGGTLVASQEKNIFMLQFILPMPKEFVRLLKEKKKNDL